MKISELIGLRDVVRDASIEFSKMNMNQHEELFNRLSDADVKLTYEIAKRRSVNRILSHKSK